MLSVSERRRGFVIAAAFVAMVAILLLDDGTTIGSFYTCPFRALTHYSCFGCGMTRACREALHGHFLQSIYFHPLGVPFVVAFFGLAVHGLAQSLMNRRFDQGVFGVISRRQGLIWGAVLVFVVVFGVVRFALEVAGILTPV